MAQAKVGIGLFTALIGVNSIITYVCDLQTCNKTQMYQVQLVFSIFLFLAGIITAYLGLYIVDRRPLPEPQQQHHPNPVVCEQIPVAKEDHYSLKIGIFGH